MVSSVQLCTFVSLYSRRLPIHVHGLFSVPFPLFLVVSLDGDRLSFYNAHMSFYANYFEMWVSYLQVLFNRYILQALGRPLSLFYIPCSILSVILGWRAFHSPPVMDKED